MKKQAILSVSFGVNDPTLLEKTLDLLEKAYRGILPGASLYRAVTNEAVIRLARLRDGQAPVYAVRETLARMVLDGVTHVYVQPAYLLHGQEYEELAEMVFSHRADFVEVRLGEPLLASQEDLERTAAALIGEAGPLTADEAAVFIGHGSHHYTNAIYCALDYALKDLGGTNVHLATFHAYPTIDKVAAHLEKAGIHKVHVAPFMFVAGPSALNGVAGDAPDSMAGRLRAAGFEVTASTKCLGEYPAIRDLYTEHLAAVIAGKEA